MAGAFQSHPVLHVEKPEARFPAGQRLLPRPSNVTQESAGSAVLPEGGCVPASQASPPPTLPGGIFPPRAGLCGRQRGHTKRSSWALVPKPWRSLSCGTPLDARAEKPWAELSLDQGLVPLAPWRPPCDLTPRLLVCPSRASAQEQGQTMMQVPPSGLPGMGPMDGASEEATCSQRRALGGHSACCAPRPCLLLSASCSPPWLSKGHTHPQWGALCRAPGLPTDPPSPPPSSAPLWCRRWKTWGGEGPGGARRGWRRPGHRSLSLKGNLRTTAPQGGSEKGVSAS